MYIPLESRSAHALMDIDQRISCYCHSWNGCLFLTKGLRLVRLGETALHSAPEGHLPESQIYFAYFPLNFLFRKSNTRPSTASIEHSYFILLPCKEAHRQALEISLPYYVIAMHPRSEALHPHRRKASRLLCHNTLFQPSSLLSPGVVLVTLPSDAHRTMIALPATAIAIFAALTVCIQLRSQVKNIIGPKSLMPCTSGLYPLT